MVDAMLWSSYLDFARWIFLKYLRLRRVMLGAAIITLLPWQFIKQLAYFLGFIHFALLFIHYASMEIRLPYGRNQALMMG